MFLVGGDCQVHVDRYEYVTGGAMCTMSSIFTSESFVTGYAIVSLYTHMCIRVIYLCKDMSLGKISNLLNVRNFAIRLTHDDELAFTLNRLRYRINFKIEIYMRSSVNFCGDCEINYFLRSSRYVNIAQSREQCRTYRSYGAHLVPIRNFPFFRLSPLLFPSLLSFRYAPWT